MRKKLKNLLSISKKTESFRSLEKVLGYSFKKEKYLVEALTHSTFAHEKGEGLSNERLEFLGDSVLNLCVGMRLMELYPTEAEGYLSQFRSQMVSERSLAEKAKILGLGSYIRMGKGEISSGGRERPSVLADTLEAILAAIFLDSNLVVARSFVDKMFSENYKTGVQKDAKSQLQELCQKEGWGVPQYKELKEGAGPKSFHMTLWIAGQECGKGTASSKKEATLKAAEEVLRNWYEIQKRLS